MKKPKILLTFFLIITVLFVSGLPCHASEDPVKKAADSVLSYFTPVSGTIESAEGDRILLRLEGGKEVAGMVRLTVFTEGDPFYHPVTKEKIGNTEFASGVVEIKEKAGEGLYAAELKKGKAEKGDKARLPTSKVKLAFFQERKSDWALSELFYNELKSSGRFEMIESYTPSYEREELSKLAADLGAEAVLLFSTPLKDKKKVIGITLFWAGDASVLADIEEVIDREINTAVPGDEFLSIGLVTAEPWNTYNITSGRMMAMGDINNNGSQEIVVSDGNSISIYSLNREMREEWKIEGAPSDRHLSIDVMDINNNGYAEVFVTNLINERELRSFVLEYHPSGAVEKINDNIPYFMRVSGRNLLMQQYGYIKKYMGPVHRAVYDGAEYIMSTPLDLPAGVNIYGFTQVDWQENGKNHLLALDDEGILYLFDEGGRRIWRSEESYGVPDVFVTKAGADQDDANGKWFVRERLITLKTERGQEVFVMKKIPEVLKAPGFGYRETEIYSLRWDGADMEAEPVLSGLPGGVNDYMVTDSGLYLIVKGSFFTLIRNTVSGDFRKGSTIYYYNIKEK